MPSGHSARKYPVIAAAVVIVIMVMAGVHAGRVSGSPSSNEKVEAGAGNAALSPVAFLGNIVQSNQSYGKPLHVVVILDYSNQTRLNDLLYNLTNQDSPQYHKYLTAREFDANFSPPESVYRSAIEYFMGSGMYNITTFPDRSVLSMFGTSSAIENAFHTGISASSMNGTSYIGPTETPELPSWLAGSVYDVVGLSSEAHLSFSLDVNSAQLSAPIGDTYLSQGGFPVPQPQPNLNNAEAIFGSDLQVAYNETQLFKNHYDRGEVIATLLWAGNYTNSTGASVSTAPFDPSDIYSYFNQTYPTNSNGVLTEPLPTVTGVPILNAPPPGPSAKKDTSGATLENTLDLEMVGSLAPGSQIFNVYGPSPSVADLTQAFATVLSPPSGYPQALLNTTVISNSWGGSDGTNATWNTLLEQAQARGITVLASSGDSGDSRKSQKFAGGPDIVQFPSTDANNTYGVTAVGGTNLSLNQTTLKVNAQEAWYINSSRSVVGSTGGISSVYAEPSWQINSSANLILKGKGRGVPDLGAIANNTVVYYSNSTYSGFFIVSGTSISSPVEAGIVATMDAYLNASGESPLGFIDPLIYGLGTSQYNPGYRGSLPLKLAPFFNVTSGRNYLYNVTPLGYPGYNLVTGMGSINAYNFLADSNIKRYNVSFAETGLTTGTRWSVYIVGHTYSSGADAKYVNLSLPNGTYQFMIPDIGNLVGVPPQSSITVNGANLTVSIVFEYGYEYNFTQTGLPANKTWSLQSWYYDRQYTGSYAILYFPNGSYSYTARSTDPNYYGYSGHFTVSGTSGTINMTFRHGRFNVSFVETGLPIGQQWKVTASNSTSKVTMSNLSDNITFYLYGGQYSFYIYPSGKDAPNISAISLNTNGQNQTIKVAFSLGFFVTFRAVGLTSGTAWGIEFHGMANTTTNSTIVFEVPNGTYSYSVLGAQKPVGPSSGTVNVTGQNVTVEVVYSRGNSFLGTEILYLALLFFGIVLLISGVSLIRRR